MEGSDTENRGSQSSEPSEQPIDEPRSPNAEACGDAAVSNLLSRRLGSLDEYLSDALARPNLLEANVAGSNCTLMRCLALLDADLIGALKTSLGTIHRRKELLEAIEMAQKLGRQISRFAEFERRATGQRKNDDSE